MAFVKLYTTQTGDLAPGAPAPLTTPIIVNIDFPINPSGFSLAGGVGTNHTVIDIACTGLPAAATNDQIRMDFGPTSAVVADRISEDEIVNSLNEIMGEAVAAPYAIPDYKQLNRSGGYLEPDTIFLVQDLKYD